MSNPASNVQSSQTHQYEEAIERILYYIQDALKFGHGEVVVNIDVSGGGKRVVHVRYARDYKYMIPTDEIKSAENDSRRGSAN